MKAKYVSPSWFNLFMPISIAAHFILPIEIIIHSPWRFLGLVIILVGFVLNRAASASLRQARTPVDFKQTPVQLVVSGSFRVSRNPIYLGGLVLLLGIAIFLGSLVSFFFPAALFLLLHFIYIPIEEKELEGIFGADYIDYKRKVRRWI